MLKVHLAWQLYQTWSRLLAVMYSERRRLGDNAEVIRLISAREATRSERTAYEEGTR